MTRARWLGILRGLAFGGLLLAWMGITVRGQDRWILPAMIHYATPWLPRLGAGLFAAIFLRCRWQRALAATCALISLPEGWHSFRADPVPSSPPAGPVVSVWNAARALDSREWRWEELGQADLSAVVETGTFSRAEWDRFTAASPDHEWKRFDASTMLGVRGKILSHEDLGIDGRFRSHRVLVELPEHGELTVVVADVRSQPWISREQAMAGILRAAGNDPRAIILGDFNTPPESVWFREWKDRGFTLANDGPRRGFRETWAYGLPLLTLDQIWLAPGWRPVDCTLHRGDSDHARVVCLLGR